MPARHFVERFGSYRPLDQPSGDLRIGDRYANLSTSVRNRTVDRYFIKGDEAAAPVDLRTTAKRYSVVSTLVSSLRLETPSLANTRYR
jgi:hypothetical protein